MKPENILKAAELIEEYHKLQKVIPYAASAHKFSITFSTKRGTTKTFSFSKNYQPDNILREWRDGIIKELKVLGVEIDDTD